jgi:hypothetical protein
MTVSISSIKEVFNAVMQELEISTEPAPAPNK